MRRAVRLLSTPVLVASILGAATAARGSESGAATADGAVPDAAAVVPSTSRVEVLALGARALFGNAATTLTPSGEAALERLIDGLAEHGVSSGSIVEIRVVGHADGLGPTAFNQTLSERRAAVVGALLARRYPGVPLVIEGRGESEPVASDADAAGRARNRRVEIRVVSVDGRATPP